MSFLKNTASMPVRTIDWWEKEPAVKTWQLLSKCMYLYCKDIPLSILRGPLWALLYCSWKMITYLLPWIRWILLYRQSRNTYSISLWKHVYLEFVFCLESWLQSDAGVLSTLSFEEYYRIPSVLWCPAVHALHWIYLLGT